jgi:hypothetical protein
VPASAAAAAAVASAADAAAVASEPPAAGAIKFQPSKCTHMHGAGVVYTMIPCMQHKAC